MPVEQMKENGVSVLNVQGSLGSDETQELEDAVLGLLENGETRLVFDFSELDYINSSGLRVLVLAYQRLKKASGTVAICGVKDYIREIFEVSGYDKIFSMYPDRGQALEEL
jgi:anti-sigma B factor antagonist